MAKNDRRASRIAVFAEGDNRAVFPPENLSLPLHVSM
jgi:hypothetical protein